MVAFHSIRKKSIIFCPYVYEGFELQPGAIFGFGKLADDETNKALKISTLESSKHRKLNQAPVHNPNEDRSIGWVNHEINIRCKKYLKSVSRKMVISKSVDLLHKADLNKLKKYIKPAAEIKQVKII